MISDRGGNSPMIKSQKSEVTLTEKRQRYMRNFTTPSTHNSKRQSDSINASSEYYARSVHSQNWSPREGAVKSKYKKPDEKKNNIRPIQHHTPLASRQKKSFLEVSQKRTSENTSQHTTSLKSLNSLKIAAMSVDKNSGKNDRGLGLNAFSFGPQNDLEQFTPHNMGKNSAKYAPSSANRQSRTKPNSN